MEFGVRAQHLDPIDYEDLDSAIPFRAVAAMLLSVLIGVLGAVVLIPEWAPELARSLFGDAPKAYWYLSRASAFAAYCLLWAAMVMGLAISNKMARLWPGGPAAFEIHQFSSLLGLNLALFHALILLGDRYIEYRLDQVLIPFRSVNYEPFWVGVGQVAFYGLILISLSFYIRKSLGRRLWRALHYLSFLTFVMILLHGLQSGTDSDSLVAGGIYVASGITLLFLLVNRILVAFIPVQRTARPNRAESQNRG